MRKIKFISILLVLSMLLTVPAFAFSTGFDVQQAPRTYPRRLPMRKPFLILPMLVS